MTQMNLSEMANHSSIIAWKTPRQRSLVGYTVHGVAKSQIQLRDQHFHFNKTETDSKTWRSDFWLPRGRGLGRGWSESLG